MLHTVNYTAVQNTIISCLHALLCEPHARTYTHTHMHTNTHTHARVHAHAHTHTHTHTLLTYNHPPLDPLNTVLEGHAPGLATPTRERGKNAHKDR